MNEKYYGYRMSEVVGDSIGPFGFFIAFLVLITLLYWLLIKPLAVASRKEPQPPDPITSMKWREWRKWYDKQKAKETEQ